MCAHRGYLPHVVACTALIWCSRLQDVAASYGLGAVGGYVYLRLLHRSVDSVAGESSGAGSSTRLLLPVILVLAANRRAQTTSAKVDIESFTQ